MADAARGDMGVVSFFLAWGRGDRSMPEGNYSGGTLDLLMSGFSWWT